MTVSAMASSDFVTLPSISLDELQDQAAFLTRRDRKYLVPTAGVETFVASLGDDIRILEIDGQRTFSYRTAYFEAEHFVSYLSALRQRPNRFKVRTRLYAETGRCLLEVKLRNARGQTVKHQIEHDPSQFRLLDADDRRWLASFDQVACHALTLTHCVTTSYRRSTFTLPNGAGRVTIDHDLAFTRPDGQHLNLPNLAIVETKGAGPPTVADRLLWRQGVRPQSISKFAISLSLLIPDLPANRWHRLRNRLDDAAVRTTVPPWEV
jgi:hypothetical protein